MSNSLHGSAVTIVFVVTSISASATLSLADEKATEKPDPLLKRIIQKWAAREKLAKAAKFVWTETRHYKQGSLMSPLFAKAHDFRGEAAKFGVPRKECKLTARSEVMMLGDWMKYRTGGQSVTRNGDVTLNSYCSSYDGKSSRMVSVQKDGSGLGGIRPEARNTDARSYPLIPLTGHLRATDKRFRGLSRASVRVIDRDARIRKHQCVVLSTRHERIWVDIERLVVLRWEFDGNNGLAYRIELHHKADSTLGWYPNAWTVTEFRNGDPKQPIITVKATVIEHKFGLPLKRRDFRLEFPPGVEVFEGRKRIRGPLPPDAT